MKRCKDVTIYAKIALEIVLETVLEIVLETVRRKESPETANMRGLTH
ncbi:MULTISPECIES: hypothetical protein [Halomonas]|uniref:Uncharacterized protein n=1 Tax=Halomonas citrativorans TaxID=2742612 RepID=A0A1R4I100_9GAMM|nr:MULTISPECIES: hypothetical protein [Halomonas]SJN13406.1 hypothetical protein CZ787_10110 [Halomonas citrativorans]